MMEASDIPQLRRSLAHRLRRKAELEQQVCALRARIHEEIDPLREEVLRLQMERLKEAAQARMRSARLRNAYHDAQDAYRRFRAEKRSSAKAQRTASNDLKATYRRASKLCHPDTVPDSYEEEAAATFQALESAFEAGHGTAVHAIADALDTWGFPPAPTAADNQARSASDLRRAVSALDASIDRLQASEAHQAVDSAADVQSVVEARKHALKERLVSLKRRRGRSPHR